MGSLITQKQRRELKTGLSNCIRDYLKHKIPSSDSFSIEGLLGVSVNENQVFLLGVCLDDCGGEDSKPGDVGTPSPRRQRSLRSSAKKHTPITTVSQIPSETLPLEDYKVFQNDEFGVEQSGSFDDDGDEDYDPADSDGDEMDQDDGSSAPRKRPKLEPKEEELDEEIIDQAEGVIEYSSIGENVPADSYSVPMEPQSVPVKLCKVPVEPPKVPGERYILPKVPEPPQTLGANAANAKADLSTDQSFCDLIHELKDGNYQCRICPKSLTNKSSMYRHIRVSHRGEFRCTQCGNYFSTKDEYKEHKESHRFPCPECDKTLKRMSCVYVHLRKEHNIEPRTQRNLPSNTCYYCEESFATKSKLKDHISEVHSENSACSVQVCLGCHQGFSYKDTFDRHREKCSEYAEYLKSKAKKL